LAEAFLKEGFCSLSTVKAAFWPLKLLLLAFLKVFYTQKN
jgi:hypothetical protein